jgi:heterodisulfide reductase subunit A
MPDEIRIGVFVCDCGTNIAGVLNVPELVAYARTLPLVVLADEGKWSCSVDYLGRMQDLIRGHGINRVVVASCTPRTHEPLFKRTVREAGVNPYLLEFVSIREQVSWVHMREPQAAAEKAKDLIKMGAAKAALLEEGEEIRLPVQTDCLIIGGGVAGMNAALSVAAQGFQAHLIEQEARLGGILNRLCFLAHDQRRVPAAKVAEAFSAWVTANPRIKVYTGTRVASVQGYIGNYQVALQTDGNGPGRTLAISTIIVATGMREIEPAGQFEYGRDPRVMTQLQLDTALRNRALGAVSSVVMINCVNSKNTTRGCCNIGCHVAVKNAVAIKTLQPAADVFILYRDMSLVREEGEAQMRAKQLGVKFLRFPDQRYPEVRAEDGRLRVKIHDQLVGREFDIPADRLVLTTALQGDGSVEQVKGLLKVSANADAFFQEAHVKLGPLEFATHGVALAGCAKAPMFFKESCEAGVGAAMKVSIPMKCGYIETEGIVADIDLTACSQCGLCAQRCPYNAIRVDAGRNPAVIKALCKGCGLCAADCPNECISIVHYTDAQVLAQVDAALQENPGQKIIAFVCHWCALGGVDMAGVSRLQYPPHARLIRVMCSARVSIKMMRRAFEGGAAGVLVAGCEFPTCHYIQGNYAAETRVRRAKKKLAKAGFDPAKLWNIWCSAADGPKFANTMREMVKELIRGSNR